MFKHSDLPAPSYVDLKHKSYLSFLDVMNPMHRLWTDGHWNKLTISHGCYWHRHPGCKQGSYFPKDPKQGVKFWHEKFEKNIQRDHKNTKLLEELGWNVIVVWECQTKSEETLRDCISRFLSKGGV